MKSLPEKGSAFFIGSANEMVLGAVCLRTVGVFRRGNRSGIEERVTLRVVGAIRVS
jgi:hypothetical protein